MVGAVAIVPEDTRKIITLTENGFGKRADCDAFPKHNRGGKGVICHKLWDKTGSLVGIAAVNEDEDVMLITNTGTIIRTRVAEIPVYNSRSTGGVIIMRLADDMKITGFAVIKEAKEDEADAEGEVTEGETSEGEGVLASANADAQAESSTSEE